MSTGFLSSQEVRHGVNPVLPALASSLLCGSAAMPSAWISGFGGSSTALWGGAGRGEWGWGEDRRSVRVLLFLVHGGDFLRDLLLRVGALRQFVQVLHVVEALGDALGRHAGLGVVVPALHDGGAHHLDAL